MTKQRQVASWRRAFVLLLAGVCVAWLQGCATKPQVQYKVYFCNMESAPVSEIRVTYGGTLWATPTLPPRPKEGDARCLGGYSITTMLALPEGMVLKWVFEGRRYEAAMPIKSRLNGIYPTSGIQVIFQSNRVELFEYVYPTNNHLARLRIYPPIAPKPAPGPVPKKLIQVTGNGAEDAAAPPEPHATAGDSKSMADRIVANDRGPTAHPKALSRATRINRDGYS